HASVIICPFTSVLNDAPAFRVTVEATPGNGLRVRSQVMADKPTTVRRDRVGSVIGLLAADDVRRLNAALAFAVGLAD
ncbi:MAG: type II toxin-antitoxin system PemK/MazF family toxin, partial [Phenylobacterium sp.]|nr:type II toxin-antitoxin system PemK/MazF family toxin [Phenylobacterium sp.]